MSLPMATTTLTVSRINGTGDPYVNETPRTIASGVRGHVSAPSGGSLEAGGDKELVDAVVYLPSRPQIQRSDTLTDETTGDTWSVVWSRWRHGLGLDHQSVGVKAVRGEANG